MVTDAQGAVIHGYPPFVVPPVVRSPDRTILVLFADGTWELNGTLNEQELGASKVMLDLMLDDLMRQAPPRQLLPTAPASTTTIFRPTNCPHTSGAMHGVPAH